MKFVTLFCMALAVTSAQEEEDPYAYADIVEDDQDQSYIPEELRSYTYDERHLATLKSFASPCTLSSQCTNKCCKSVRAQQTYSYYGKSTKYYGYATSYGAYTYRYSSYFPSRKMTYGKFLKSAKLCMNPYDSKNTKICPKSTVKINTTNAEDAAAGAAALFVIIILCGCCCTGVAIWACCCRSKPAPQSTVVVVQGDKSDSDDKPDVVHNTTVINNTTNTQSYGQPGMQPMMGQPMMQQPMMQPGMQPMMQPGMQPMGYPQPGYR